MAVEYVLQTSGIEKVYDKKKVLDDVTLNLEKGKVYGLIGKNGAGKTTLMRLICGLSYPTSGKLELFGKSKKREYNSMLSKLGALIEYPTLNGKMTAKENLKLNRIIRGITDSKVENEVLELVGLSDLGSKKVKDFSLGMRQRLSIAIAILSNPDFLILDEPVNGLDPIGVVEIRKLIKQLNESRGITILISSHNLQELYQTATNYIIIDKGSIKKNISLSEIEEQCQHYLIIESNNNDVLIDILQNELKINEYEVLSDNEVKFQIDAIDKKKIVETIHSSGLIVYNIESKEETLESYFISIVGEED